MITVLVWWLVLGYVPTAAGAALATAALSSGAYAYRPRHGAPGRRRSRTSTWEQRGTDLVEVDESELRAARVRTEQRAAYIEQRAALWNDGRSSTELAESWLGIDDIEPVTELHRHDPAAGSPAYLDLPIVVVRARDELTQRQLDELREQRITTAEMTLRFGAELGPVLGPPAVDEWELPAENGPDHRAPGRHARGRETIGARP